MTDVPDSKVLTGYSNKKTSLLNALSSDEKIDPIVIRAWMIRLENRLCANLGTLHLLQIKREIDTVIYEIKRIIYSYHNLDDLLFVNSYLAYLANRTLISREDAFKYGENFLYKVQQHILSKEKREFRFYIQDPNVLNLFRDFKFYNLNVNEAAENIAEMISKEYRSSPAKYFKVIAHVSLPASHPLSSNEIQCVFVGNKETGIMRNRRNGKFWSYFRPSRMMNMFGLSRIFTNSRGRSLSSGMIQKPILADPF